MNHTLHVYNMNPHRVVLVGFERAKVGAPGQSKPDLDTRGTLSPEFAYVVSMMQGDTITVRLHRLCIDNAAKLYVISENSSFVKVKSPTKGHHVPASATADIELEGVSGGNPNETTISVRFGSDKGPVVHRLIVRCFSKLTVVLTPHVVTVAQAGGGAAAVTSIAAVADVFTIAQAIWRPYGVIFNVQVTLNDTVTLAMAGIVSDSPYPDEVATVLGTNWIANTINVYFVPQIGTTGTLGYGFSRGVFASHHVPKPGILLGDRTPWITHDTEWAGNDLAHEAGHFFGLTHVDNKNGSAIRQDYWSRRMLMHNNNRTIPMGDYRDDLGYGQLAGRGRRGGLVTHKDLSMVQNDAECKTARTTIVPGPY